MTTITFIMRLLRPPMDIGVLAMTVSDVVHPPQLRPYFALRSSRWATKDGCNRYGRRVIAKPILYRLKQSRVITGPNINHEIPDYLFQLNKSFSAENPL